MFVLIQAYILILQTNRQNNQFINICSHIKWDCRTDSPIHFKFNELFCVFIMRRKIPLSYQDNFRRYTLHTVSKPQT